MIKSAIIDDESKARLALRILLDQNCPDISVVREGGSLAEGKAIINDRSIDLVFLDIALGDGNAFDLLNPEADRLPAVVFVTGFDEFAVKAFRYSAIDYLLKPVDAADLKVAVARAKHLETQHSVTIPALAHHYRASSPFDKLVLPGRTGYRFENIDSIVRCALDDNYTLFFLESGERILVSRSLSEYSSLLEAENFCRIHQSHLINLRYLKAYIRGEGGQVVLLDGTHLNVSRRRKHAFLEKIGMKS